MRKILPILGVCVLGACGSSSNLNEGVPTDKSEATSGVDSARFALDLIRHARDTKSIEAYMLALQVMAAHPTVEAEMTKTSPTAGSASGDKAGSPLTFSAVSAEARAVAAGNNDALARIDAVAASAAGSKGAAGGPKQTQEVVRQRETDVYEIAYRGGRQAEILVSGDGDSDLDLFVFDENGNLVCSDQDATDDCYCQWWPRWTGTFAVEIRNFGVANRYVLLTN